MQTRTSTRAGRPAALLLTTAAAWAALSAARPARAQEPARPARAPAAGSVEARLERLERDVRELRQMLIQSMQAEQQRYDLLLKLVQSVTGDAAPARLPAAPPGAPGPGPGAGAAAAPGRAGGEDRPAARGAGTITGEVDLKGVPSGQPVFVFVENLSSSAARGRSLEIVQKDKQFSPQVAAVQRGTTVYFPNHDSISHNVFSLAPRNAFDLGLIRAGERGDPVRLAEPGVIEVYCNIHGRMWAEVLVVPNAHYAKVGADGRFTLRSVPAGERVVAVWTAGAEPVRRTVTVSGQGAEVRLSIQARTRRAHNNKFGQPYGHYQD
jgi:plastocyanin